MSVAAHAVEHDEHEHHGPPEANRSSRVEPATLGMLLFICSEIMIFGAFFTAYFFIRVVQGDQWFPVQGHKLPVAVAFVTIRSFRGHYSSGGYLGMEVPGIYWHFVDVMWIVVFFSVYII